LKQAAGANSKASNTSARRFQEVKAMARKAFKTELLAEGGDTVSVVMGTETEPRTVTVPADLKKALAKNKDAKAAFDKLSYTHRKEFVQWIEGVKREETRAGRTGKALAMMADGKHP
jgi:uncharacterized protein YdeI (YjbR/CyaY-like superfamily)